MMNDSVIREKLQRLRLTFESTNACTIEVER
jgi:hypothetical protein